MLRITSFLISTAFLAVALLALPNTGWAGELPEGVTVQVVAEYPVDIPGVEKVLLKKFTLQPGATLAKFVVNDQTFCNTTQGVVTVIDHTDGSTTLYTPGSRWAPVKGHTFTVSNPGDETHVHWVYAMIEKKQ